jgi:hypothetical protein
LHSNAGHSNNVGHQNYSSEYDGSLLAGMFSMSGTRRASVSPIAYISKIVGFERNLELTDFTSTNSDAEVNSIPNTFPAANLIIWDTVTSRISLPCSS